MITKTNVTNPGELLKGASDFRTRLRHAVCVIENMSSEYVEMLSAALNPDSAFLIDYTSNPIKESLWLQDSLSNPRSNASHPSYKFEHLAGVYEYHNFQIDDNLLLSSYPNHVNRHCFNDENRSYSRNQTFGMLQSNTRLSYYRAS